MSPMHSRIYKVVSAADTEKMRAKVFKIGPQQDMYYKF